MEHTGLKIVIENHIPYVRGIFEPFGEVVYAAADEITPEMMKDADALMTRTRTKVNKALLEGSRCRVVATATIGTDHIDLEYCRRNGVKVINAPGSNAPGVAQYVFAAVAEAFSDKAPETLTIGIVGVGNIGKIVEKWAKGLGMNVLLNDPPRAVKEGEEKFVSLETIAEKSDIITFHTPMTKTGKYPTYHLCSAEFLSSLKNKPLVINAARGPVADNAALLNAIKTGKISHLAIDCWENEPEISHDLLKAADIATPHIAGYSASGKTRASAVAVKGIADTLGIPAVFPYPVPAPAPETVTLAEVRESYDPLADTRRLKENPQKFEELRNNYPLRKEVGETF